MNKKVIAIVAMVFLLALPMALAMPGGNQDPCRGSIDRECGCFGFDKGIAKWNWNETSGQFEAEGNDKGTVVNGTDTMTFWNDGPTNAAGVVIKAGQLRYFVPEPVGNVSQVRPSTSHVTFCKDKEPVDEVPEFSVLGAGLVLVAAGLFIARRRA